MSFATDYAILDDAAFAHRVTASILKAAGAIRNESADAANHANRIAWANALVTRASAETEAQRFLVGILGNSTITGKYFTGGEGDVPDSDLEFVVDSLVDTYANAKASGIA